MKPVFDKPWAIVGAKGPDEHSIGGMTNRVVVTREDKEWYVYITVPSEIYTLMWDMRHTADLTDCYFYVDVMAEERRCYMGLSFGADDFMDLWYYTKSNVPGWLDESAQGKLL